MGPKWWNSHSRHQHCHHLLGARQFVLMVIRGRWEWAGGQGVGGGAWIQQLCTHKEPLLYTIQVFTLLGVFTNLGYIVKTRLFLLSMDALFVIFPPSLDFFFQSCGSVWPIHSAFWGWILGYVDSSPDKWWESCDWQVRLADFWNVKGTSGDCGFLLQSPTSHKKRFPFVLWAGCGLLNCFFFLKWRISCHPFDSYCRCFDCIRCI